MIRRLRSPSLLVVALGACVAARAGDDFPASWEPPDYAAVRSQVMEWRSSAEFNSVVTDAVNDRWPVRQVEDPAGDLLTALAATFSVAYPEAHDLFVACESPYQPPALPDVAWLASERLPKFVRVNLRLYYARWLAQRGFFDESLAETDRLRPGDVVDPASLLFYRMAGPPPLVEPDEARAALAELMEQKDRLPRRFLQIAQLVERDLAGLEDESLDHIARRMNYVRRRLDHGRAGDQVQIAEDKVINSLDKTIDKLEQQQKQQAQQSQSGGGSQPSNPMPDSMLPSMKAPGKVDQRDIGRQAGWGDLPPKEREQALQKISRDFPAQYRDVIEQYFRELAVERDAAPKN